MAQSKHMLYPPNSQGMELQRRMQQSDLLLKVSDIVASQVEAVFK